MLGGRKKKSTLIKCCPMLDEESNDVLVPLLNSRCHRSRGSIIIGVVEICSTLNQKLGYANFMNPDCLIEWCPRRSNEVDIHVLLDEKLDDSQVALTDGLLKDPLAIGFVMDIGTSLDKEHGEVQAVSSSGYPKCSRACSLTIDLCAILQQKCAHILDIGITELVPPLVSFDCCCKSRSFIPMEMVDVDSLIKHVPHHFGVPIFCRRAECVRKRRCPQIKNLSSDIGGPQSQGVS
ncbi:hypothetical protein BFW01_g12843 [Lasiodiplodia theobromae]|uniref:uncharacterized protein n=1 Tax=Lasiodiplodia theobromae TaxID=45133 RepID=UPI0015C3645B|nr:uncharacterized protein LTHEOB_8572 [Lasiodiplodia theobromae]KAF4541577.1 hypothetical protein LTHEOB_8572 [Lasiodiplodia theobromae]KAF9641037.1 hypothetical protein BFW01_g12843 [Lasiodiplodia theobromae]